MLLSCRKIISALGQILSEVQESLILRFLGGKLKQSHICHTISDSDRIWHITPVTFGKIYDMNSNKKRQALKQKVTPSNIRAEVGNLKAGEVLIVKTAPGIDTSAQSTVDILLPNLEGRKVLFHSLCANTTKEVSRCHCRQELEEPLLLLCDGKELNVYKELSVNRPDIYIIGAAECLGDRAQNSDELAHDLLVYYAVKFNTAIVAFVQSRTALGGDAEYEYDLYGRELILDIERTPHLSEPYPDPACYGCSYYDRKMAGKYDDRDYYKEFRRILSQFLKLIELNDDFVRKSIKGYCFKNVFVLDEELDRFESAFHDKTPFNARPFVEQVHTQIGFLGDRTGFLRHYFGLGVKPESFRKAKTLAGSYFDLKSSISIISHLFMSTAEAYLKILHSNEEFMKESAKY